ncbi:hypothetical protein [Fundidesulfovibrio soli]|uniref:hypothetical protein n=1 Tax=Fundidesulfovibrio soli TaxID=2922716 RepID=UPI001FAFFCD2|nr:hypothetical protein [Fundidesulfovibrio soli]
MPHAELSEFVELRLKKEMLDHVGLPDINYPVPVDALDSSLENGGNISFASLLYWLQVKISPGKQDWKHFKPAMSRLAELVSPPDDRSEVVARSDEWWIELGPVDLNSEIVTIQRESELIAAISRREDGRLRVATFWPIDSRSAEMLFDLSRIPNPNSGVNMRENNWEYALDASAATGNVYASERGDSYLSYWKFGIGISHDKSVVEPYRKFIDLIPRRPSSAAIELGVFYEFSAPEY